MNHYLSSTMNVLFSVDQNDWSAHLGMKVARVNVVRYICKKRKHPYINAHFIFQFQTRTRCLRLCSYSLRYQSL